jgi:signal transduction histidine kinase
MKSTNDIKNFNFIERFFLFLNNYWKSLVAFLVVMGILGLINSYRYLENKSINETKRISIILQNQETLRGSYNFFGLCSVMNCNKLTSKKHDVNINNCNPSIKIDEHKIDILNVSLCSKKDAMLLYNKEYDVHMSIPLDDFVKLVKEQSVLSAFIFLLYILILYLSVEKEQNQKMISIANNEAIMTNRSMVMLTENIHHELNTPLEVIENKISKIKNILFGYVKQREGSVREIDKQILELEKDFEYIKLSSDSIISVMDKMKGFKNLRYSNGNKNISHIIQGACDIIGVTKRNFEYEIQDEFKQFKLPYDSLLKNADLLNILINHLKNSLEANANKIIFKFKIKRAKMELFIIDNGLGISDDIKDKIYSPNFSSKNGIRGNGMTLCKNLMKGAGGDDVLVQTSSKGTVIKLIFSIEEICELPTAGPDVLENIT